MEFSPVHDPIRQAMIDRLIKGKESLLQFLLQKSGLPNGSDFGSEVATEVERSFSDVISMLSECESSQIAAAAGKPVAAVDRSSKGLQLGQKRAGFKDRRGCYRRRNSAQSWVTTVPTTEDGYAWRKYGQKGILNTSFPRCYFRCTHKHDQQCKAKRQVQRIKESPLMYQITYLGPHTCRSNPTLRAHQIIPESGDGPMESCSIMSFETNKIITPNTGKQMMMMNDDRDLHPTPQISDVTDNKSSWQHQKLEPSNTANSSGVCNHHNSFNDQEVVSGTTLLRDHQMELLEPFGIGSSSKFDDLDGFYMDGDIGFSQYLTTPAEFLQG